MIIEANGIEINAEVRGSGRPLFLLHGNGEDHTIFQEAADVLSAEYTCWMPDTRGHGMSRYEGELHYDDFADDLAAILEKYDIRDAAVFGFSDGGITALLAAMRTGRISDLIISGANLNPDGVKKSLKIMMQVISLFSRDPKVRLMLQEPHISDSELAGITCPVLVLAGSDDVIREEETRHIAAALPHSELRILEGEGHGSYIVHSDRIAKLIKVWLEGGRGSHGDKEDIHCD